MYVAWKGLLEVLLLSQLNVDNLSQHRGARVLRVYMSYSLNSMKGGYIGEEKGDNYRDY